MSDEIEYTEEETIKLLNKLTQKDKDAYKKADSYLIKFLYQNGFVRLANAWINVEYRIGEFRYK